MVKPESATPAPDLITAVSSNALRLLHEHYPVLARAPALPPKRPDGALTEIMPPFGTNPPTNPVSNGIGNRTSSSDLTSRAILNDPRELWYLALPSKLTPKQVLQILRSALGGDIWQQWQLLSLMLDSWPMLRKCSHEIRSAAARVQYKAKPYCAEGKEPTRSAKEKSDFVNHCIKNMRPDPMSDERGFAGMVYDFTDALLNGLEATEILWKENAAGEIVPRAAAWIHPRHFTYSNDGKIVMFDQMYQRLMFNQRVGKQPDNNKFIVCQYSSRSGSSLGAGLMRPLAYDWSAVMYNRDWMLTTAQNFGSGFISATVAPNTPEPELAKIDEMLANAGNQRWIRHVVGSEVKFHPPVSMGSDNPQRHLMELADEHCQLLLLGQTVSTHGKSGGLNGNDDAQAGVRREFIESLAEWVGTDCLNQFAAMICRLNWGDDDECPTIEPDFTETPDPLEIAQRDAVFLTAKVPMDAEGFYKRHNLGPVPQPGDQVMVGGQLGHMGATDTAIEGVPEEPEQVLPGGKPKPGDKSKKKPVKAADPLLRGTNIRALLGRCDEQELTTLQFLMVKAKSAPHLNGEAAAVDDYMTELANKHR